jgi:hypothetical protein
VLGGLEEMNDADIRASAEALAKYGNYMSGRDRAIDMGGGIGRVSKGALLSEFKAVDMVEQSHK